MLRSLLLGAALGLTPVLAAAQVLTRSDEIGGGGGVTTAELGRYVFAGIGIDTYQNPSVWKVLDNAVNDVERMRETLTEEFEFESPDGWVLTDEAATQLAIRQLIDDLRNNLQPDDNLVFFYAGHGTNVADVVGGEEVGRTGYIVPVEAKLPAAEAPSQYIEIEVLLEMLARLPARHVLVILDSCYSGMALEGGFKMRGDDEPATQQARDLISRRSRRVLTSAQADQQAADGGEDFPDNSLFTAWLIEGLTRASEGAPEAPNPDTDEDGMVTVTELYTFVRGRVGSASESRQTPDFGAFDLDDRGELVLTLERDPFDGFYAEATASFEEAKFDRFFEIVDEALELESESPRASYLRYLRSRVDDDLGASLTSLRELAAYAEAGADIPLSRGDLAIELRKVERQCAKSTCAVSGDF